MGIRVLQIEDDFRYYDILKDYLEPYQILIESRVDSIDGAIKALEKCDFDFILVDMDLYGDDMAGIKVIKAISHLTKAYIVVLSGSGLEKKKVYEAYSAGAYAYEYKMHMHKIPIVIDEILKGIYTPIYYVVAEKLNKLKDEQKKIAEDLQNNLSYRQISKKHNKTYEATKKQIARIKQKLGNTFKNITGSK